jgi:hypothetical protein
MRRRFGTAVATALMFGAFAFASGPAHSAVGSTPPATPQIGGSPTSGTDGSIEVARQITQCGEVMYVGGTFTQVRNPNSNTPVARNNAFAFRAVAPHTILPWNPNVNGGVYTVACAPDGGVYLGGAFTTVGGTAVRNLAKVDGVSGANQASFTLHPAGRVNHVEVVRDQGGVQHLLVGGQAAPFLRSVNPLTGGSDGYGTPTIAGTYQFAGVAPNTTRIYNMTVFPAPYQPGSTTVNPVVLMTGTFTSVGGQRHEQVFRLNLTPGAATVSNWTPRELYAHCHTKQPFYAQDAAWSTDMTRIFVVTTGYRLASEIALPSNQRPQARSGPCDAVISYAATETAFDGHQWINYTGCDSLYSVAADRDTVFIGGHQRWISNGDECDRNNTSPGRAQPGLGQVSPSSGTAQAGPARGRGLGAADLLRTPAGLWVASDNQANTATCGTASARMGICFLPAG